MLLLNLLPQRKKRALRRVFAVSVVRTLLEGALLTLSLSGIALTGARAMVEQMFADLAAQSTLVQVEYAPVNREIAAFNRLLAEVERIAKDDRQWSLGLTEVVRAGQGLGIRYEHLQIAKGARDLSLQGVAETRGDLLALQARMRKIPFLTSVEVPITDLLDRKNARFVLRARLVPEAIAALHP